MAQLLLIVDADQGFTEPLRGVFEAQGVTVEVRDDASLELVRRMQPSAILISVELPKGATTGLSLCSRLRRDREFSSIPILLTSASASTDMLKKHAESPDRADEYARKPMPFEEFVSLVDRLLAIAPASRDRGTNDVPRSPIAQEDEFDGESQTDIRATRDIRPPSLPPELPKKPSSVTVRPQKRDVIHANTTAEELWRTTRLDEALRALSDAGPEPQAPPKPGPEERLAYLRQLVKFHETRDRTFREAWERVQQQGQELARRTLMLGLELSSRERKLDELQAERDSADRRLAAVDSDFRAFQQEITRIFREKDTEEQQTFARLTKLETENAALIADLNSALEQNDDHARRLQIFQEEFESLQSQKEESEQHALALASQLEVSREATRDAQSRLETAEAVASERADAIETLREALDRASIEATQAQLALTESLAQHQEQHREAVQRLEREQQEAVDTETRRGKAAIAALEKEREAIIASITAERDIATDRAEHLASTIEALTGRLEETQNAHIDETRELRGQLAAIEDARIQIEHELVATAGELETLTRERDRLRTDLETRANDLAETLERLEVLESTLDDERANRRAESREQEAQLEAERARFELELKETRDTHGEFKERTLTEKASLEKKLEAAERETFERVLEFEKYRSLVGDLEEKSEKVRTDLEDTREELGRTQHELKNTKFELGGVRAELEDTKSALNDTMVDQATTRAELQAIQNEFNRERERSQSLALDVEQLNFELKESNRKRSELTKVLTERDENLKLRDQSISELERRLDAAERARRADDDSRALVIERLSRELDSERARNASEGKSVVERNAIARHRSPLVTERIEAVLAQSANADLSPQNPQRAQAEPTPALGYPHFTATNPMRPEGTPSNPTYPAKGSEPPKPPSRTAEPTKSPSKTAEPTKPPSKTAEPTKPPSKTAEPTKPPSKTAAIAASATEDALAAERLERRARGKDVGSSGEDPFAQLLAELEAASSEPMGTSPFGMSFDTEATHSEHRATAASRTEEQERDIAPDPLQLEQELMSELGANFSVRRRTVDAPPEEDSDDRSVTEIVRFDNIK